ncbi:MAG: CPXCG motif-containing cysteine-rich protein [Bacteroidota bacterium]
MAKGEIIEQHFTCPYCWQSISVLVDTSAEVQSYIEDCEVCCRPIRIDVVARGGAI